MAQDFLLEIGIEEMPARFMQTTLTQLKTLAKAALDAARLDYQDLGTHGTPRRLCLYIAGLAERQKDQIREVKGPAKKAAFDEAGVPTKAALGFARGQGVAVDTLVVKTTENGEYVFAVIEERGRGTAEVLPNLLHQIITDLSFPKPMRWGEGEFYFARPIHWLTALFGSQIIPVTVAGIESGRETFGHRFLAPDRITLGEAAAYFSALAAAYVMVQQDERKALIRAGLLDLAAVHQGSVDLDEGLLEEVTHLVEYPTVFAGSFSPDYLSLPEEVVVTPMKEHQRYFPLRDTEGQLLPKFLAVRNGNDRHLEVVREGNEKVLLARLSDAHFFYLEDQKEPLANKVEGLKSIVFQEKLGTLWEKTRRNQKLAAVIGEQLGWDSELIGQTERTARLAKGDLVTHMVHEFPELQGIMGGYYAAATEDAAVAAGIREHYRPRFAGDAVPDSPTGIAVGIADKVDTITGCFLAGLIPSGSQDPYALRRQALGICHTILAHRLPLSLKSLTATSVELYAGMLPAAATPELPDEIMGFYRQRLENILQDEEGWPLDVVRAVLAVGAEYPADARIRCEALARFMAEESFLELNTAFTRAFNLAKNAATGVVEVTYLQESAERHLFASLQQVTGKIDQCLATQDYIGTLTWLATLREPIDAFFDGVMVMVEDEQLQRNRLALLENVVALARQVADFSLITAKG